MQSNSTEADMFILEDKLKMITKEFDDAIGKDMVLKDVKRLYHELKILSVKLLDLRKQHASTER